MHSLLHLSSSFAHLNKTNPSHLTINPDDGMVYAAAIDPSLGSIQVWSITLSPNQAQLIGVLQSTSLPLTIIDLKALPESCQLCLITSDGRLSICSIADQPHPDHQLCQLDNIGTFEDGIRAAAWSPDDELLVIVTHSHKLVLLTKSFDILCEHQIEYGRFGDDQPISLGWGTKATQFHGSLGKSAAQASKTTADLIQSESDSSDAYQISWRGDGAYFAVTCPGRKSDDKPISRLIKVYSRTASLSSSSESISNSQLGDQIAWKPDGSIIASSVRDLTNERLNIIFFERNGLQRYGFDLNQIDSIVNIWGLAWNTDSSVLAVGVEKRHKASSADGTQTPIYAVQLWTRNNYHWYFKHEAQADLGTQSTPGFVPLMMWHPEKPHCIYLSLAEGLVEMRKFVWDSIHDVKPKPDDTGSVAVIDGYHILLTPFRFQVVPPPMSSFQLSTQELPCIENPRIPTHVAFSPCSQLLCALFPGGNVSCYLWSLSAGKAPRAMLVRPAEGSCFNLGSNSQYAISGRQITIMELTGDEKLQDKNHALVVLFSEMAQSGQIRNGVHVQSLGKINAEDGIFQPISNQNSHRLYAPPGEEWWKIFTCGQDGRAYIQTSEGIIKRVSFEQSDSSTPFSIETVPFRLPEFCPIVECIKLSSSSSTQDSDLTRAVGLTGFGKLFLNEELIASDCSSFTTDLDYLIYTNYSHQLKFLELTELIRNDRLASGQSDELSAQKSQPAVYTSSMIRAVERGSIIVTSVPSMMKIILQMPRGNLEAIHPRPMVLRTICVDYLKNGRWKEAFIECRKHKIDLNLLVDFDRSKFLDDDQGVSTFIQQIDNNEHFCLFLSGLKSVDVTKDLYPITRNWKPQSTDPSPHGVPDDEKINTVCNLMVLQLSQKQVQYSYINSILTAMVCKKPPDYKSGLTLLARVKSEFPEKLEDAVKYMIFLSDVNELYRFALSIYDLSLVVLIAQYSQKDPKEYLPFLQSLRDLEPNKLKFKIDDYLGNYSSGIKHLALSLEQEAGGNQTEVILNYTKLHNLYKEALEIYSKDTIMTKSLRNIQGDWLMDNNKPFEAGLVFMLAGEASKAIEGYRQAEAWQEMFALIVRNPDGFDLLENAQDMASRLSGSGRFVEAASILLQFGDNISAVVSTLCDGQAFSQAILTALSKSKSASCLIAEMILPSAQEYSTNVLEELDQLTEDLKKQVDRLDELKVARETNPDLFFLGAGQKQEEESPLDGVDAMTEATTIFRTDYSRYTQGVQRSNQSLASSRTGRSSAKSSKMRKKEAKKKAIGKKGSIYEEEYLLNTLSKVCSQKLPELQNTIGSLVPALVQLMGLTDEPSISASLLETTHDLQAKFEDFQHELTAQVAKVWDQDHNPDQAHDRPLQAPVPATPDDPAPDPTAVTPLQNIVPKPALTSLECFNWKLEFI